jgi:hypothetical protein
VRERRKSCQLHALIQRKTRQADDLTGLSWLRGSATPDPCEIDPKTQKAPLRVAYAGIARIRGCGR